MSSEEAAQFLLVMDALQQYGLLLESDARLPSVANIVAGGPIRGSWWAHPQGNTIYQLVGQLADHPDVLVTKLVSGKRTYIQRRLWSALISIATAHEPWQFQNLSNLARTLLEHVTQEQTVRTDQLSKTTGFISRALGNAARELEKNLLVYGESIHTSAGAHAKHLETWQHWASRIGFTEQLIHPDQGKLILEDTLLVLNMQFAAKGHLPWLLVS